MFAVRDDLIRLKRQYLRQRERQDATVGKLNQNIVTIPGSVNVGYPHLRHEEDATICD